ncbi:hypothetical protein AB0C52_12590 [Streptomyces sp. NPDC048717]|uniref:hypothetical protein n=1 Tax=Streptomyces sp. NPDC048717 TaxID=3154928 RepID=UPI00343854F3
MANISQIVAVLKTADVANADTQGRVYLGIAGREFLLAVAAGHQRGSSTRYVLGEGHNIDNTQYNDPRKPQLDTDDLDRYSVYIRFEPVGPEPAWAMDQAYVAVNPRGKVRHQFSNPRLEAKGTADDVLWLGDDYGKQVQLKRAELGVGDTSV